MLRAGGRAAFVLPGAGGGGQRLAAAAGPIRSHPIRSERGECRGAAPGGGTLIAAGLFHLPPGAEVGSRWASVGQNGTRLMPAVRSLHRYSRTAE